LSYGRKIHKCPKYNNFPLCLSTLIKEVIWE